MAASLKQNFYKCTKIVGLNSKVIFNDPQVLGSSLFIWREEENLGVEFGFVHST